MISGRSRGEARGAHPPPILSKKGSNHRRKKSWQGKKKQPPSPLAQGLDPPLMISVIEEILTKLPKSE